MCVLLRATHLTPPQQLNPPTTTTHTPESTAVATCDVNCDRKQLCTATYSYPAAYTSHPGNPHTPFEGAVLQLAPCFFTTVISGYHTDVDTPGLAVMFNNHSHFRHIPTMTLMILYPDPDVISMWHFLLVTHELRRAPQQQCPDQKQPTPGPNRCHCYCLLLLPHHSRAV